MARRVEGGGTPWACAAPIVATSMPPACAFLRAHMTIRYQAHFTI